MFKSSTKPLIVCHKTYYDGDSKWVQMIITFFKGKIVK